MATATINVSGIAALRYYLTAATTFYFTGAVDGQKLRLTLVQGSGAYTVTSGNCPGIMQPSATSGDDSTQELCYDAATNTWNQVPQGNVAGTLVQNTYTTNTTISWAKGTVLLSGSAAMTLSITNPTAGPPGIGNDGEIMWFGVRSAHAHKITMLTTQSINGSSTTAAFVGVVGEALGLMAFGGNVYIIAGNAISTNGGITLS
jgi:hypothetical protein